MEECTSMRSEEMLKRTSERRAALSDIKMHSKQQTCTIGIGVNKQISGKEVQVWKHMKSMRRADIQQRHSNQDSKMADGEIEKQRKEFVSATLLHTFILRCLTAPAWSIRVLRVLATM